MNTNTHIYGSKKNEGFEKIELKDLENLKNLNHFSDVIIVSKDEDGLRDAVKESNRLSRLSPNTTFTIITEEKLKENDSITKLEGNIDILFSNSFVANHGDIIIKNKVEEFFEEFRYHRYQHLFYDLNPNFEKSQNVPVNQQLAEKRQDVELLAAAQRFIAFECCDENGNIKDKYKDFELGKIHSSFKDKDNDKVIEEAKNAVCGGVYDKAKFNQEKKKSIYSGEDKFKASIDKEGYLVIQSVGDNIQDEYFARGVKTNFKFERFKNIEITQDNLSQLFTDDSYGKDSRLAVLGAIELAFEALRTIEKGSDGKLINPNSSEQFNAIFPGYGQDKDQGKKSSVQPELRLGSQPETPAPPPPPPADTLSETETVQPESRKNIVVEGDAAMQQDSWCCSGAPSASPRSPQVDRSSLTL